MQYANYASLLIHYPKQESSTASPTFDGYVLLGSDCYAFLLVVSAFCVPLAAPTFEFFGPFR